MNKNIILNEDNRNQLLQRSKKGDNYVPQNQRLGKNRYERRVHSKIASSVREYNQLDMNKLFKNNILDVSIKVRGETNNYEVKISFGGFLDILHEQLERNNNKLELRSITRALISSFNSDNVYIHCSCPDWSYRFSFWARVNNISSAIDQEQTDNGKEIQNPNDTKGPGCKHTLLVLSNTSWIIKVSSVINNYVKYMEQHQPRLYADIIYPAIYQQEYQEPVQLDMTDIDNNELTTDDDILDTANKWNKARTQFQKGNTQGIRFAPDEKKQINFDNLLDSNEEFS